MLSTMVAVLQLAAPICSDSHWHDHLLQAQEWQRVPQVVHLWWLDAPFSQDEPCTVVA
jgi:hypothetical protein